MAECRPPDGEEPPLDYPCPTCRRALVRVPGPPGRHWACPGCGGRALPEWRLGPPLPRSLVERLHFAFAAGGRRGSRRCPFCSTHFFGIRVPSGEGELFLDACDECGLLWFDGGEHEAAGSRGPPPPRRPHDTPPSSVVLHARPRGSGTPVEVSGAFLRGDLTDIPALLGLPVEEGRAPPVRPWAVWAVAAAIAVASVAGFLGGIDGVAREWGFVPATPLRHGGLDLLTSFLLHLDPWHLLANLYFLLLMGDDVEDALGAGPFLLLLLLSTVTGDLLYAAISGGGTVPTLGASGGVSGLLAFYALAFPRRLLRLLWILWLHLPLTTTLTARAAFGAWITLQVLAALLPGASGVNHLAHVGGALAGFLFWRVLRA